MNKIYNIDCINGMKEITTASIDMIFCDLPYGKTQNKWDSIIPVEPLWEQYLRIIKDNGAILLFGQDKFTAMMMLSMPKIHRYNIIWKKTTQPNMDIRTKKFRKTADSKYGNNRPRTIKPLPMASPYFLHVVIWLQPA